MPRSAEPTKPTRRAVLAGLATGLTLPPARAWGQPLPAVPETALIDDLPKFIDCHVHVWTPDTQAYPLAAGHRRDEMAPPSFTPEQLMAHAKPCGVRRVALVQMSFYGFDNSYMLDTIAKFPGVYSGIAVIDDEAARPQEEMLRLKGLGVRGFRIYPRNLPPDRWLDGTGMQQMWRWGAQQQLAMCHLINPDALPAVDAMCSRFPDTPVVIDHLARIGVDGQIREADVAALCRLARHKQAHVKVSAFYALGQKQPPYDDLAPLIRRVFEAYGPDRLMWGSDCPYQVDQQKYCDSVDVIRQRLSFLSDSDREWLLWRTAERVFFT